MLFGKEHCLEVRIVPLCMFHELRFLSIELSSVEHVIRMHMAAIVQKVTLYVSFASQWRR